LELIQIKYSYRLIIFFFLLSYSPGCDWSKPESVLLVEYTDTPFTFNQLIFLAEKLTDEQPKTIKKRTQHHKNRFGGRSYVSLACYWWPDPNSEDGLPYIRKDGKINPETRTTKSDLPSMIEMARRVEILATAYNQSGNEKFAESAILQIKAWFLDEQTAMLPHLEHAQMVKGQNTGRSYGVIDTWWMVRVVDSVPYLRHSDKWTAEMETGLLSWFTHYLNWLLNSEFGVDLANERSFLNAGLHQAVLYLIRQVQNTDFDQILDPYDQTDSDRLYLELLLRAQEIYHDTSLRDEIMRIEQHVVLSELAYY
jgi:hypothetical protein